MKSKNANKKVNRKELIKTLKPNSYFGHGKTQIVRIFNKEIIKSVSFLKEKMHMEDEFSALFEASKALVTYIDNESVFDRAAAGGCSGMDFHLSDTFYDLIVNTRNAIKDVENGPKDSNADGETNLRLFEATKALATHIEKEHAFDKVNDMGSVGIETYQSDALIEVIKNTFKILQGVENGLKVSE
jgi:hypothetical protein